jgi:hypothetical protein
MNDRELGTGRSGAPGPPDDAGERHGAGAAPTDDDSIPTLDGRRNAARVGFWAAILTVLVTVAFAAVGVATPARSGPFCGQIWPCVPAPYTDVAQFIPGDYLWLIPGILLVPIFVVLIASIHARAPEPMQIFSGIGLAFAVAYAVVIGADYFVQFAVVIPSLQSGETEGLMLVTQYNPHGLFIAGEALGYLAMSLALLFAALVFTRGRMERAIRWLFVSGFVLAIAAFLGLWLVGGDLVAFEVSVLSINWIVLIASAVLLGVVFRRAGRSRN